MNLMSLLKSKRVLAGALFLSFAAAGQRAGAANAPPPVLTLVSLDTAGPQTEASSALPSEDTWGDYGKFLAPQGMVEEPPADKGQGGLVLLPVPYAGYNDVYGFLGGGALVLFDNVSQTRLAASFITNFNDYDRGRVYFQWRKPQEWIFNSSLSVGDDIQDYFGEGDQTPDSYTACESDLDQFTAAFQYNLSPNWYLGPSLQYLYRDWDLSSGPVPPALQDESEWRLGVQTTWDSRDSVIEPQGGAFSQLGAFALPAAGEDGFSAGVWQFEADARAYARVLGDVVLAGRVNGAYSLGDPSYSFVYTLGGANELRGFHTNRFRGTCFYGAQVEARVPLSSWLAASTSVDLGDVSGGAFTNPPLASYQVGLRSDVLSNNGVVLRADLGFGYDDVEFNVGTSEPF